MLLYLVRQLGLFGEALSSVVISGRDGRVSYIGGTADRVLVSPCFTFHIIRNLYKAEICETERCKMKQYTAEQCKAEHDKPHGKSMGLYDMATT